MSITGVPWFCAATTSCGAKNFTCAAAQQAPRNLDAEGLRPKRLL
jgi:hypothetical protein